MSDRYFADFRAYINELQSRGKLRRWKRAINKDTEMMPLMRLQYRGISDEERQALLFENMLDSRGRQ
jgi:3-polyprenyl-4-hydroxybenzoate decarboxylase